MSELEQNQQLYPSPNKLPSLRDIQSRQKQFNKMSAQRLSISKQPEIQQQQLQDASIPPVQQPPSQLSGKKYYQSRYIHSPGQAMSYQRSGAQDKNYEQDISVQQTPVSQFSTHTRNKSEYQGLQQERWEIDPGLVDDSQIEQFVEQLLLDDMVAQQLRDSTNMKGFQVGKGVKELVLRLTNQIMMNQGLRQQQSAAFQNQYNTLKQDYLKLQSELSRRIAEQHDRIQRLENDCQEKDELLIRESKTRQMLENQNQENTKRLSEVTGEYHSKLQMKEDIFYQKGQECYNEINVLRSLVGELQEKLQIKDNELVTTADELIRANERIKGLAVERDLERNSLQTDIYQWQSRVEQMELDEKELAILVDQLKGELALLENQCAERENHIRVCEEERKRDVEGYELMLKEKDQQRVFEVNNLVQLAAIESNKHSELRDKYLMKIALIEDQIKKLLVFKQDTISWMYQQKNQMVSAVKIVIQKFNENISKNAAWYKKLLKERDTEYNQQVISQEKEINNLNERWQEMMQQQEMQLRNEHRSELLQEVGKMETRIVGMQGQINDYQANYVRLKEQNEVVERECRQHSDDNERNLKEIGELDAALEDCEWKYQKEIEENKQLSAELLELQQKWEQTEKRLNQSEKIRVSDEHKLKQSEEKCNRLQTDIKELVEESQAEKNKFEQNDKEKKGVQQTHLVQINDSIRLKEEIVQNQFEITKLRNTIVSKDAELQDRQKEKEQLLESIEEERGIVKVRDNRIRQIELLQRQDLANYLLTNQLQEDLMNGLKQEKQLLVQHIGELDRVHKEEIEQKQREKVKVIEELHGVIAQLNERNNELRQEKRTVEGLLANKKKLEHIIDNLNKNIEELKDKLGETQQRLKQCEEAKDTLQKKFNDYKLQQLKQKKQQLVSAKKILGAFKADYLDHKNNLENIITEQNANIQVLRDSIEQQLNQLAVQYAQELNNLRMNLDQSHTDYMNQLVYQEKERGRVQVETVKKQMAEQIIQLSEEINTLKKKLQNVGGEKQMKGQNLDASEMVKRFSTQQLQDIQSRYLNIKSEFDSIVSETKGKYQTIQQLHEETVYTKEQIAVLKHFTDIQDVLSDFILQSEELLKKYQDLDAQRDRELKASQSLMQSKIISSNRQANEQKKQEEIPYQLTDSFSPTQYSQRRDYEQQQQQQQQQQQSIQDFPSSEQAIKIQKLEN